MEEEINNLNIGQRVQLLGKNICGRVAYLGQTNFATGNWVGVILDENRGRNNGQIRGVQYFKCPNNYGIFVRATQLQILNDKLTSISTTTTSTSTTTSTATPTLINVINCPRTTTTKITIPQQIRPAILTSSSQLELNINVASRQPPKRSKTSVSPSDSKATTTTTITTTTTTTTKGTASFIETGFLEILKPNFTLATNNIKTTTTTIPTPTTIATPTTTTTNNNNNLLNNNKEINILKGELERLQQQCQQNKNIQKDMEQLRLQNAQLLEFKTQIMQQQSLLQRDLQRLQQQLRDALEIKQQYGRQLDELNDNTELLTLDKEMAEERAETLQLELELAQERIEELTLDLELLRLENTTSTSTSTSPISQSQQQQQQQTADTNNVVEIEHTTTEFIKMQQQQQRMKETVLCLRDALTQQQLQLQQANKQLETKYSELAELQQSKQRLSQRVDILEAHIIELKEQVDAALGAETMVANLAALKIESEERIKLLEEEVSELEALEQIHEQLIESNQELELDLREEITHLKQNLNNIQEEKRELQTQLYDRELTINKFRELVKLLQQQQQSNKNTTDNNINDLDNTDNNIINMDNDNTANSTATTQYNQLFLLNKTQEHVLELQINKITLKNTERHINWLLAFLPEQLLLRGGTHDAILVMLTLQRLLDKLNLLIDAINDKFPSCCDFDKADIYEGYSVHRCIFRCQCLVLLYNLKLVLEQLSNILNASEYELCAQAAIYRKEIELHEQSVDELLRLLKAELLDEHTSLINLERALVFYHTLLMNLFALAEMDCQTNLLNATQLMHTQQNLWQVGFAGIYTTAALLQNIIQLGDEQTESFAAMSYLMQHMENYREQLKFHINIVTRDLLKELQTCNEKLAELLQLLVVSAKEATRSRLTVSITHMQLWQILCCQQLKLQTFKTPAEMFQQFIKCFNKQLMKLNEQQQDGEEEHVSTANNECALLQRATQLKQFYEQMQQLRQRVEERDKEIKTLKQIAHMKQQDFSELQIRKDLAERNLNKLQLDWQHFVQRLYNWQKQFSEKELVLLNSFQNLTVRLEKFEAIWHIAMKHLNFDKIQPAVLNTNEKLQLTLQLSLQQERKLRGQMQLQTLKENLHKLTPIQIPRKISHPTSTKSNLDMRLITLQQQLQKLKNQWLLLPIQLKNIHLKQQQQQLRNDCAVLLEKILTIYYESHAYCKIPTNFGKFATKEFSIQLLN